MERNSCCDRLECFRLIREVPGIFLKKILNKRFRIIFIPGTAQKEMLQFTDDSTDIKNPIRPLDPFQIKSDHIHTIAEKEIGWRGIAVHQYGTILPHPGIISPVFAFSPQRFNGGIRNFTLKTGDHGMGVMTAIMEVDRMFLR